MFLNKDEYYVDLYTREDRLRAAAWVAAQTGIWTMKDGTKIPITEMSTEHLENCIKMIERNDKRDLFLSWLIVLKKELNNRKIEW